MRFIFLSIIFLSTLAKADFIGIPNDEFRACYRPQKQPLWCWASSAEMVLAYQKINMPQERVVERIKGFAVNQTGSFAEMIRSVNGVFEDDQKNKIVVSGQIVMGAPLSSVLYNHLKQKRPVVLTYQASQFGGHAVVITGAEVEFDGDKLLISEVSIFDPYCYRGGVRPIYYPNGMLGGFQEGLEQDMSLSEIKAKLYSPDGVNLTLVGRGVITSMILIEGTMK